MKEDKQMKQRRKEEEKYKSGISAIRDVKDFLDVFLNTHTRIYKSNFEYPPHELIVFGQTF